MCRAMASSSACPSRRPSQSVRGRAADGNAPALAPAQDVDRLVLEQLVRLEEVLDLHPAMRSYLVEPLDVLLVRIADRDAQDLEVEALLVAHLEASDGPGPEMAAGEGGFVDQD